MTELSPAAQACVATWVAAQRRQTRTAGRREALAAFAEALADQVVPENGSRKNNEIRHQILAIAAELRGEPTTTEPQP